MNWIVRAKNETRQTASAGSRTWFVTLTVTPSKDWKMSIAGLAAAKVANALDAATPVVISQEIAERSAELELLNREVDRWLDRVRGKKKVRFRYLLVFETHKSGSLHIHALVHESGDTKLSRRWLEGKWSLGLIRSAKLVRSEEAASYVAKYLGKDLSLGRVRASKGYGRGVRGEGAPSPPTPENGVLPV